MVGREVDGQHVLPLYFVIDIFDWSDVKLTGLCGWPWATLGASAGSLGPLLGPLRAVLGRSWGLCGRSWGVLSLRRFRVSKSVMFCLESLKF